MMTHIVVFVSTLLLTKTSNIVESAAFVNVSPVRTPPLKSTSTSVTWEPAHVLTDVFQRNPFAVGDNNDGQAPTAVAAVAEKTTVIKSSSNVNNPSVPRQNWFSSVIEAANQGCGGGGGDASLWKRSYNLRARLARQKLQGEVKVSLHHFLRDSGLLRSIMEFLATIGVPALAVDKHDIIPRFLKLTMDCVRIPYGDHHAMQVIDMYMPEGNTVQPRGLLFFVHGGAWGSGLPWMYRLIATPFLERGMAVAIVGYRTFPDGDMNGQVHDLEMAAHKLTQQYPNSCSQETDLGVTVMGHSSGAHIAMTLLVNRLLRKQADNNSNQMRIDSFVGISAPYEIASHYEYETLRGLQELSLMKAAAGRDKERLSDYSPVLRLFRHLIRLPRAEVQRINDKCPRMAMIHGNEDDTVPFSSTRQAARLLSIVGIAKCEELYLSDTGHSDTVVELMFGGKTKDALLSWMENQADLRKGEETAVAQELDNAHAQEPLPSTEPAVPSSP